MASLQPDLAGDNSDANIKELTAVSSGLGADCRVKLNRRSLGGLAFEVQFGGSGESADDAGSGGGASEGSPGKKAPPLPPSVLQAQQQAPALSADEIAERLAAAELRREQQLAERVGRLESQLSHVAVVTERKQRDEEAKAEQSLKTVEETLKAAEERRLGRMEEVKQRARGLSAGAKERSEAVREKLQAARQTLEAELDRDIRTKEARRREQIEKIVQGAQQHLAKVEGVRNQRLSTGPNDSAGGEPGSESKSD